jgi:hypothetical protein
MKRWSRYFNKIAYIKCQFLYQSLYLCDTYVKLIKLVEIINHLMFEFNTNLDSKR